MPPHMHPGFPPPGGMPRMGYSGMDRGMDRGQTDPFRCTGNAMLGDRYRIIDEAGKGNFARVMRATDTKTQEPVAVKILSQQYARDGQFEHSVLKEINKRDRGNGQKVSKMLDHFTQAGCPCFVFPLLGPTLKSCRLGNGKSDRDSIRSLALELADALRFLHFDCKLVHTDLKPENILVDKTGSPPRGIGNSWTVVDFGSASFFTEKPDRDLISTRPYRAPEVVVGGAWGYAADMWSVGCILYEVYKGRHLFDAANDHQHLQLMQRSVGTIPSFVRENGAPQSISMFDATGRLRRSIGEGPPTPVSGDIDDPELLDLLTRLLEYDPVMRLRSDEMLLHPFCAAARRRGSGSSGSSGTSPRTRVLAQDELPRCLYTAGHVRTPGVAHLAKGGARPKPERCLEKGQRQGVDAREQRSSGDPRRDSGYQRQERPYAEERRQPPAEERRQPTAEERRQPTAEERRQPTAEERRQLHFGGGPAYTRGHSQTGHTLPRPPAHYLGQHHHALQQQFPHHQQHHPGLSPPDVYGGMRPGMRPEPDMRSGMRPDFFPGGFERGPLPDHLAPRPRDPHFADDRGYLRSATPEFALGAHRPGFGTRYDLPSRGLDAPYSGYHGGQLPAPTRRVSAAGGTTGMYR